MLHAFSAATGKELMGLCSPVCVPKPEPTDQPPICAPLLCRRFAGRSRRLWLFPPVQRACVGIRFWSAASAMAARAVFALDVDPPEQLFREPGAEVRVMGIFRCGRPRLGLYLWNARHREDGRAIDGAVVMGNGYNNTQADGNASATGQAALFVLFLEPGAYGGWKWTRDINYIKIPVWRRRSDNAQWPVYTIHGRSR